MLALIDADFIKYVVLYDIEKMFKGGLKPDAVIPSSTIEALTERRLDIIRENVGNKATDYIYLFSGRTGDNYRAQIACVKKYKGNRTFVAKVENDKAYRSAVEEYIKENYNYHREGDLEADDLCVMAHDADSFIYSHDKDLRMSPGLHYDIPSKKFVTVSKEHGFKMGLIQSLSGDSTDNIQGIHGVGKVGAARIVNKATNGAGAISNVISKYVEEFGDVEGLSRFVEMYTLVNMKTSRGDWTKEKYIMYFEKIYNIRNDDGESDFI